MRRWLLPFSWLYGIGSWWRNKIYDLQIRKSVEFELPVICVGNLSSGGTGKTPHVEYLITLLKDQYHSGVLSRGYKRKTRGYFTVETTSSSDEVGDEPLQIKRKFPDVMMAVCEERAIGIPIMLLDYPQLQVIILDDAFQHRQVKAGLSILLTAHSNLFSEDQLLPAGNLRESPSNAARADVIVVTKCPDKISLQDRLRLTEELRGKKAQPVLFSSLEYDQPYELFHPEMKLDFSSHQDAVVVTGIASADLLMEELRGKIRIEHHFKYRDHHRYSLHEVKEIIRAAKAASNGTVVITTEKDGVRLLEFRDQFVNEQVEIYCVPVKVKFIGDDKVKFDSMMINFITEKLKQ